MFKKRTKLGVLDLISLNFSTVRLTRMYGFVTNYNYIEINISIILLYNTELFYIILHSFKSERPLELPMKNVQQSLSIRGEMSINVEA